jgi:hypothetical protein
MDNTVNSNRSTHHAETIRLQVDSYDIADLERFLADTDEGPKIEATRPAGSHGEPVTIAILTVTPLVVQAISLWMLQQRRKKTVEIHAEKIRPDGSHEKISVQVKMSETTSSQDVVEQVVQGMHLDPGLIDAASQLGG